jgi:pyridoxal phosphate enzyme (YggS family)
MNYPVTEKLKKVKQTIPSHVRLVAVSKKVPVEVIESVYREGIRDFAENRLQEALDKQTKLSHITNICWHFIGHLQTNKAKKAVESFPWIHSVDSLKLAQRLDYYAQKALDEGKITQRPQVCLQVKVLPDENKYGWEVETLWQHLPKLQKLNNLHFRGLMTILPLGLSSEETLLAFEKVAKVAQSIRAQNYFSDDFNQLSMGMSGDYLLAIRAGATMIRLGRIIFAN